MPGVALSPDGRWLVVTEEQGWAKTEVYFADLHGQGRAKGPVFQPLVEKVEALFNVDPPQRPLLRPDQRKQPALAPVGGRSAAAGRATKWKEIIPEGKDVLETVAVVGDVIVGQYMEKASSRLRLFDRAGKLLQEVPLPTLGTVAGLGAEWDGDELLFGFQSFTRPQSVYRLDLKKPAEAKPELWGQVEADIDFSQYRGRASHLSVEGQDADHDVPGPQERAEARRPNSRRCSTATAASTSA